MKTKVMRYAIAGLLVMASLWCSRSDASVVIGGTRVVYPAQEKEVTLKMTNEGSKPALVQVWLDDGDEMSTPETAKVPFTVAPPIFRLDANKSQAVRMMYTREPLPSDRESLFWLNALEVPPTSESSEGAAKLQFAFRTRIKLLFRPHGLAGEVAVAPEQLTWSLVPAQGEGWALRATNPTAYHVNFAKVRVNVGGKLMGDQGGMVAPFSSAVFPIRDLPARPGGDARAEFTVINDYGALRTLTKPLAP